MPRRQSVPFPLHWPHFPIMPEDEPDLKIGRRNNSRLYLNIDASLQISRTRIMPGSTGDEGDIDNATENRQFCKRIVKTTRRRAPE